MDGMSSVVWLTGRQCILEDASYCIYRGLDDLRLEMGLTAELG